MQKKNMLRRFIAFVLVFSVLFGGLVELPNVYSASESKEGVPEFIELNKESLTLKVNQTDQLIANVYPDTVTDKTVSWKSSNTKIATVDANGVVKGIKKGTAVITVTANGNKESTKQVKVTVQNILPSNIKLSKSKLSITKNQKFLVNAVVSPSKATDKSILWSSSNKKVATVDSKGTIKGITNGTATITASTKDNPKVKQTIKVTVSQKTLKVNKASLTITAGKKGQLSATVSPSDSNNKTVKWSTSNKKVATVNSKGTVTAKAKGTATITATVKDAKSVKVKITVKNPVKASSVQLNKTSVNIVEGKTAALTATVKPANAVNKTVKWTTSNKKIATVDSKGKVTGKAPGTAKVTATTTNGKKATATIKVTAKPYVKTLGTGTWTAGKHLKSGRYKITTKSGTGNLVIGMGTDRFVNEILSSEDDGFGVVTVTTNIKSGDKIEISGLNSVTFTEVKHVKRTKLHSGYWTVGKDISAGRYKMTTPEGMGNLIITRGKYTLVANEILSSEKEPYAVRSVTKTLKNGDLIYISGLNQVNFTKSK